MSWLPDWLTGFDRENYDAGVEADRKNRAITEDLHNRQLISDKEYQDAVDNYDEAAAYNPDQEIGDAFNQGLDEGATNIRNAVGGTVNTLVGTPLKLIPWQLWLAGGLYLAWRLGAFSGLLKRS